MKKRIISYLVLLCLLISIVPQSAFAATGYKVYVNGAEFTSTRTTIDGVTFDASTSTLTLRNVTLSSSAYGNAVITAERSIRVDFYGTNTINLLESSTDWHTAFNFTDSVYLYGNSGSSLVINSASKNCTEHQDMLGGKEIYRIGILSTGTGGIMMSNMNITMNDNSQSSYLGHSILLDVYYGSIDVTNSKLTAKNLYCGIISDEGDTNYINTEFDFTSNAPGSYGITTGYNNNNIFRFVEGTISAEYGMRCYGPTEIYGSNSSDLNITGKYTALYIDKEDQNNSSAPTVLLGSGTINLKGEVGIAVEGAAKLYLGSSSGRVTVNIDATNTGIFVGMDAGDTSYCELTYGEVNVKKGPTGIAVNAGSTFKAVSGNLNLTGNGASQSIGIQSRGTAEIKTSLNISNYQFGIYTNKVSRYDSVATLGGSMDQSISATLAGIYSLAGKSVIDRDDSGGYRSITITAPYGISPASGAATAEIKSGTVNIKQSTTGILVSKDEGANGALGKMKISGGKINITGTKTDASTVGISSSGELEISGSADISFSNNRIDFNDVSGKGKITGGNVQLSSSGIGMYLDGNYEMSGGVIASTSCSNFAIVHLNGDLTLSGGKINTNISGICLTAYGNSNIKFAGANVSLKTTEQVALYSVNGYNSYEITGGTVELKGSNYAANSAYSGTLPSGYVVLAGNNETDATVKDTFASIGINNKYVKFTPPTPYTLTLENVAEGTSASVVSGASITYTAAEAPVGKHFDHWEMKSGNGSFTSVGTNATYSGTMPASNATLKAVYVDCRFDSKIENFDNFADMATCDHGAIYYYSCSVCGDSARFVQNGPTFESGEKASHDWSQWIQNNDGKTHTRVCANNNQHKDTENCSGGTATCTSKAVCTKCKQEYGNVGDHSFTAKNTDSKYLASNATCGSKATYYYSCSACGAKGTNTFEVGEKLDHAWSNWTSQGDGTHKRVCSNDSSHVDFGTCSGGSATCSSKAVCTTCGTGYGSLADHSFTAQNTDVKYRYREATCDNKAMYYYSCTACGAKGTNKFEIGEKADHAWGKWTSVGDGTHKRVCSTNSSHVETGTCSGGTATTESKAVCTVCGGEYGSLVPKNASVTIPTKATLAGNEVIVSVLVTSNPGLSHFEATITYDSNVLTLVSVSNGSFFDSSAFNAGTIPNNGTYKISFDSSSDVMKASGVLVDLKFKVKEGNTVGTYPISFSGSVIGKNAAGSTIDCTVINGGVKVAKPSSGVLGDVDGDGKVSTRDLLLFRRYLNGTVGDAEMFYIDCADVDGDNRISTRDLLKLKQYLAGIVSL